MGENKHMSGYPVERAFQEFSSKNSELNIQRSDISFVF